MSKGILLLDYEPRNILRVTEALAPLGYEVMPSKDVESAIAACAQVAPRLVIISSVLPRLKVDEAITQLRARAGLKDTPILVLMSGYSGKDIGADAARIGAQAILAKPFSNEDLVELVKSLAQRSRPAANASQDSHADVLEALRRSAGLSSRPGKVPSKELSGDLIERRDASPDGTQRTAVEPQAAPAATPVPPAAAKPPAHESYTDADLTPVRSAPPQQAPAPKPAPVAPPTEHAPAATRPAPQPARPPVQSSQPGSALDKILDSTLADGREAPRKTKSIQGTGSSSVDDLLSQTLSGLDVKVSRRAPRPPEAAQPVALPTPAPPPEKPALPPPIEAKKPGATTAPPEPRETPASVDSHATSAPDTGTAFGQYDLIELVATGGMAEVFKARMRGLGGFQKIVAIKRILPHLTENDEFVTMFVDEAKLAAGLQHPNIIHIYDLGKLERSYYIAMEYIDGNDLRSILRLLKDRGRHLPLGIAIYIASRLGAALDYAHRKRDLQGREMKLVHRDVSPQNVLISYDGDIKLCDFGIAKAASKASHTRAGALKGKLQYMSPEQAWAKDIDLRSDIFSLGLVLYEMLTGRKAFTGDSELSVLELVRSPQIVPPRDLQPAIPPEVERIVLRALQENRDDRYQTAADFVADLDGIMQNLRPAPDARELGSFLADLMGKETLVSQQPVPSPRPAVAAPTSVAAPTAPKPKPAPRPAPPAFAPAAPHPVVLEPRRFEVEAAPKRRPIGLIAGVVVVALATVAGVLYLMRDKQPIAAGGTAVAATPAAPVETPAPEGGAVGLSPVAAPPQAEGGEAAIPAPTAVPTRVRPTVPAGVQLPAAPPTRTAVTTTPALAPAAPTPAPTEAPLLVPATPTPAPQLTRAPEAEPTPTAIVAIAVGPTTPATVVKRVTPVYPKLAERQRVKGTVELRFTVTEAGAVEDIEVTRNTVKPDLGCGKAAIDAARQWRFNPATRDGSPVRTKGSAVFNFGF